MAAQDKPHFSRDMSCYLQSQKEGEGSVAAVVTTVCFVPSSDSVVWRFCHTALAASAAHVGWVLLWWWFGQS
jgi:hypothetical protein